MTYQTESKNDKEQFWRETSASMAQSFHNLTWVVITVLMIFAIEDWFSNPAHIVPLYTAKLLSVAVLLGLVFLDRTRWGQENAELFGLVGYFAMFAAAVYHSFVLDWVFMASITAIFGTFASASLLPWRLRYHIIVVLGSIACVLASVFINGNPPYWPFGHEAVAGIVFSIASIYIARYTGERRFAL